MSKSESATERPSQTPWAHHDGEQRQVEQMSRQAHTSDGRWAMQSRHPAQHGPNHHLVAAR